MISVQVKLQLRQTELSIEAGMLLCAWSKILLVKKEKGDNYKLAIDDIKPTILQGCKIYM